MLAGFYFSCLGWDGGIRPTFGRPEISRLPAQLASEDLLADSRRAVLTPNAHSGVRAHSGSKKAPTKADASLLAGLVTRRWNTISVSLICIYQKLDALGFELVDDQVQYSEGGNDV